MKPTMLFLFLLIATMSYSQQEYLGCNYTDIKDDYYHSSDFELIDIKDNMLSYANDLIYVEFWFILIGDEYICNTIIIKKLFNS